MAPATDHLLNSEYFDALVMLWDGPTSRIHVIGSRDGVRFARTQQENNLAALLESGTYDVRIAVAVNYASAIRRGLEVPAATSNASVVLLESRAIFLKRVGPNVRGIIDNI